LEQVYTLIKERGKYTMEKRAVHFGAGALGRGLVIPLLYKSGYEIVLIDTNEALNKTLNETKSYIVDISDEIFEKRMQEIKIVEALSPRSDLEKVGACLQQTNVVTTSVRRENLIHVARTLVSIWGHMDGEHRMVLCCENIENVGAYFKNLLLSEAVTPMQKARMEQVQVPDTIVDRICTTSWPQSTVVTSEMFYECAVDADAVADTGIEFIPAVRNIEMNFARKRCLLNTYADAISFIALGDHKTYLYEAAESWEINEAIKSYMSLLQKMLEMEYGCEKDLLDQWQAKYRKRLSNREIPRELVTVARNLWLKLTLDERFVWPLVKLLDYHADISEGTAYLAKIIRVGIQFDSEKLSNEEVKIRLKELWSKTPEGIKIYDQVIKFF
jgi:mannitol-1-phosphate 5-dehydrogenase